MPARRTVGVVAGLLSAGAVATTVTVLSLPGADAGPAAAGPPVSTTAITRQTLIDRENHDGILGHGDTTTIAVRATGTVTALPAEGARLTRGSALFRLDNQPVTLLYGSLPAYRRLSAGSHGSDVRQLERNLWALGYRGFTVDQTYSFATATAVRRWQRDLGLTRTGSVDPVQLGYAAGPVRVDSLSTQVGSVLAPGTAVEKITGTSLLATVALDVSSGRLAHQDAAVRVTLPDGTVVPGRIGAITTVVSPGENGEPATTRIEVTIRFAASPKRWGAGAVTVAFTAGRRPNVLAVPVTALLALAEGGYGVQVVEAGPARIVAVTTGLFADGKVEITGTGLQAGQKVVMPS
jgi:peptidoglycan hydrolase-like protein with peptidoglycan-binding domain